MARWLIFCSFIVCLSMTLLGLVLDLSFQLHYLPQVKIWQKKVEELSLSYNAEKSHFDKHPFFSKQPQDGKDFADYLRARISEDRDSVIVDKTTQKTVLSLGERWLEKRHLIKTSPQVEEVFQKIQTYSKWSVYKTLLLNPKMESTEFIVAGEIFMANSLYTSPEFLIESLIKIRHMAFLLLASENFNFKLAGLSLLEKEADLLDFIKDRRMKLNGNWELIPEVERTRFRKFLNHTNSLYGYLTPPEILKKHFIVDSLPIGFCAVFFEKQKFIQWLRPFLEPRFPFEPSFAETLSSLDKIKERIQKDCHSEQSVKKESPIPFLSKIPYYRRIIALRLLLKTKNLGAGS